jgi:hypothetical protein
VSLTPPFSLPHSPHVVTVRCLHEHFGTWHMAHAQKPAPPLPETLGKRWLTFWHPCVPGLFSRKNLPYNCGPSAVGRTAEALRAKSISAANPMIGAAANLAKTAFAPNGAFPLNTVNGVDASQAATHLLCKSQALRAEHPPPHHNSPPFRCIPPLFFELPDTPATLACARLTPHPRITCP